METSKKIYLVVGAISLSLVGCSFNQPVRRVPVEITAIEDSYSPETAVSLSEEPNLDEYIFYALRNSSGLRAAYNLYQAAKEKAPQASALPEPKLSYGYFINSIETRVGPMQHRVGLAQPIPWFGKLSLKEEIADAEAKAAYYSFLTRKNKLVSGVVKAFYELAYLQEAKTITETNLELLKRWERVLASRYRSQTGTQADLIKVQVELGKLEDKLKELYDFHVPLQAHLNSLLNRPVNSKAVVKNVLDRNLDVATNTFLSTSKESLNEMLENQNPELKLLAALAEARVKGINLAKKDFYPDFSVGADYTFIGDRELAGSESGDDGLAAMFSITIPINFSKYRAGLRESEYRNEAAKESLISRKFQLSSILARNMFDISDSKRRINLFKNTLVPKAEESLESTYTAFEAGEASFLDLLDTERELLDFQLMLSRAQADLVIHASALRSLVGDYSEINTKSKGKSK